VASGAQDARTTQPLPCVATGRRSDQIVRSRSIISRRSGRLRLAVLERRERMCCLYCQQSDYTRTTQALPGASRS
jgi:hypothetical protein